MNAIIGDNGIITRAQEANIQSSIASLEEYLQLKYTENYEEMTKYQSRIEGLTNVCSDYFYIPANEKIGALRYVIDSDGHALYLIKKSGLPEEIRESLVGGDAGAGKYSDYQNLNDVYGVTANLKVYYCSGGVDSIKGLAKESLDKDNPLREVFSNSNSSTSELYGLVSSYDKDQDGIVTAEEVKEIKNLTVDNNSNVSDFKNFYNFVSLQELIIGSKNFETLEGLQNCSQLNYIYFKNSKIGNYSALKGLSNTLKYLYFYNINDEELVKICSNTIGIGGHDFNNLMYLAFSGTKDRICSYTRPGGVSPDYYDSTTKNSFLTNIMPLENLTDVTCKSIKYLSLQNNAIKSLDCLSRFENIILLRAEMNEITTLNGLENMKLLNYLYLQKNKLGEQEKILGDNNNDHVDDGVNENNSLKALSNLENLIYLGLSENTSLKFLHYISKNNNLNTLTLNNVLGLEGNSLCLIKSVISNCKEILISSKYGLLLLDENTKQLNLSSQTLEKNQFELLQNNKNILDLNLSGLILTGVDGVSIEGDSLNAAINSVLETLVSLKNISLRNVKISSIEFANKTKDLQRIDLRGTNLSTELTNAEGENIGLEILENCTSLKRIIFDGYADCSKLQNCINRCDDVDDYVSIFNWQYYISGFCMLNMESLKTLENCTKIKKLYFGINSLNLTENVNLSNLSDLTIVYMRCLGSYEFNFILPENVLNLSVANGYVPDLSNCKKISNIVFGGVQKVNDSFVYCNFSSNSEKIEIGFSWEDMGSSTLSFLDGHSITSINLNGSNSCSFNSDCFDIELPKLNVLTIINFSNSDHKVGKISNMTSLNTLIMQNNLLSDISGLENLENLTTLNLSNNSISNLYSLRNLKKLQSLNLSNNLIYNKSAVVDEQNENITINNLEILGNLNPLASKGGVLTTLYLAGNAGITDFSQVNQYKNWIDKSGF